jgi:hypothetical protein
MADKRDANSPCRCVAYDGLGRGSVTVTERVHRPMLVASDSTNLGRATYPD